ncbi:MAG: O-antigen ligase family protein [Planctomycetales bacterium]|nr:O-antigen ligase family protein [Planctomycetales bacterium]
MPTQRESLPGDPANSRVETNDAGTTLSVYPHATRIETLKWLSLFALLILGRMTLRDPASLRRIAWCAMINGTLLAVLGMNQFFSAPRDTIYWIFPTYGQVFGPFVNRNHFAFHANLSLAMGLGLLLSRLVRHDSSLDARDVKRQQHRGFFDGLLADPTAMWLVAGVAALIAGILLSLSRGGMVSMLFILSMFGASVLSRRDSYARTVAFVTPIFIGIVLVAWLGLDSVSARLEEGHIASDGRWNVWRSCVALAKDFPLLGTGYGTFPYVEPLQRQQSNTPDAYWDFAHNDYLQTLVEGGAIQLTLVLFVSVAVFRYAWKLASGTEMSRDRPLHIAAAAAFGSAMLHSFVDFGMHVPANALFVTYLAAIVLGVHEKSVSQQTRQPNEFETKPPSLIAKGAVAAGAIGIAWVLSIQSYNFERAERFRLASLRAIHDGASQLRCELLESAVANSPRDANLRLELVAALGDSRTRKPGPQPASQEHLTATATILRQLISARDICPVSAEVQLELARHANLFVQADSQATYLERAVMLKSFDPTYWYVAGLAYFEADDLAEAERAWRESLQRSSMHVKPILQKVMQRRSPDTILTELLPVRGDLIYEAANVVFASTPDSPVRLTYYRAALDAIRSQTSRTPQDDFLQGELLSLLDQPDEALASFFQAVQGKPQEVTWRMRLAQELSRYNRLAEAKRELQEVLLQRPNYPPAKLLLEEVARRLAEARVDHAREANL